MRIKSGLKRTFTLLTFIGIIIGITFNQYKSASEKLLITGQSQTIEIPKGASFNKVTAILQSKQINVDPFWFKFIAFSNRLADKIQAGEYELNPGINSLQLLTQLASGKVKQYSITFAEGLSFKEILHLLCANQNLNHILHQNEETSSVLKKLNIPATHPEGWFFPDTYFFTKNASDIGILRKAHLKMQTVLNAEWLQKEANLPLPDPYQALILASIIEKETGLKSEREKIAGVFTRRLQKGMLLQTDPTVIYGMGASYQGDIRSKDLKTLTPYNTYMKAGLPPTPIAMPGLKSIHAALHPSAGESLYFVAKGDGGHVFSATLGEHNKAVSDYLHHRPHTEPNLHARSETLLSYD